MAQEPLASGPPQHVIAIEVFDVSGDKGAETRIRWSATHEGKNYGETLPVSPMVATGYVLVQAFCRGEMVMSEVWGVESRD